MSNYKNGEMVMAERPPYLVPPTADPAEYVLATIVRSRQNPRRISRSRNEMFYVCRFYAGLDPNGRERFVNRYISDNRIRGLTVNTGKENDA